jgi:hypothetical protein
LLPPAEPEGEDQARPNDGNEVASSGSDSASEAASDRDPDSEEFDHELNLWMANAHDDHEDDCP